MVRGSAQGETTRSARTKIGATWRAALVGGLTLLTVACASRGAEPTGTAALTPAAFAALPPLPVTPATPVAARDYRIGANDTLTIRVFQIADLSLEKVRVDSDGSILFPLIGSVQAGGRTPTELSQDIAAKLSARYLQDPQVSVTVDKAVNQKVTVEGAVKEAGVFELTGRTSLLQAVAMARGPTQDANVKRVAVFRQVEGRRMAAVFDLKAIRAGSAEDPEIRADDIVVVDGSRLKGAWREIVSVLPALPIWAIF